MPDKTLEERIQRLEDIHEIHNLMGRHEYFHSALLQAREIEELFAKDAPGVTFEMEGLGVWKGIEAVREVYAGGVAGLIKAHAAGMASTFPDRPQSDPAAGMMNEHLLTTPVIEVADDGQTAKGAWNSPGADAIAVNGRLVGHWIWVKYGIDFIKEDGRWKFWHFHIYSNFLTSFEKSWVENAIDEPGWDAPPEDWPPPPQLNTLHEPYSLDRVPRLAPAPPEPYRTFQETWSYADSPAPRDAP
jgi:hypothetical protein